MASTALRRSAPRTGLDRLVAARVARDLAHYRVVWLVAAGVVLIAAVALVAPQFGTSNSAPNDLPSWMKQQQLAAQQQSTQRHVAPASPAVQWPQEPLPDDFPLPQGAATQAVNFVSSESSVQLWFPAPVRDWSEHNAGKSNLPDAHCYGMLLDDQQLCCFTWFDLHSLEEPTQQLSKMVSRIRPRELHTNVSFLLWGSYPAIAREYSNRSSEHQLSLTFLRGRRIFDLRASIPKVGERPEHVVRFFQSFAFQGELPPLTGSQRVAATDRTNTNRANTNTVAAADSASSAAATTVSHSPPRARATEIARQQALAALPMCQQPIPAIPAGWKLQTTSSMIGAKEGLEFSTRGPEGARLVGVIAELVRDGSSSWIRTLRPIYQRDMTYEVGELLGPKEPTTLPVTQRTVLAQPGYVVTALSLAEGAQRELVGFTILFVRPGKSEEYGDGSWYASPWIGRPSLRPFQYHGEATIGLRGFASDRINALGLVSCTSR